MILKVALHTHTRRSDGQMSPNEVLRYHHEQGFDAVAITDHDLVLTPEEVRQLTIPDGMLVIRGQEESFRDFYWQHVNHIYGE
ncbi:MAG: PHP domain-containing protein, partial [Dehalococcoidia bacterium]|nr:PHP domain-containing protein [Dehalococcoidia bacterium]